MLSDFRYVVQEEGVDWIRNANWGHEIPLFGPVSVLPRAPPATPASTKIGQIRGRITQQPEKLGISKGYLRNRRIKV